MALVFLGRLLGMAGFEKLVAIKVIYPHLAGEDEFVDMFLDEARLSAKIHHQNVAEVFEVGEDGGLYYMVAELVRGWSLKDLMAAANSEAVRIPPRLYLSIIAKVCDAVHSAHTLKDYDGKPLFLVHRDISPSNILLSFDGNVKLIDFGIASARERLTETRSGVLKGKTGFLAPEQLLGALADRRLDIFSLGIVLYLVATGRHPFPGETSGEQQHRILNVAPPAPRSIVAEVPAELERIIERALSKTPEHRHQTAEELGKDIRSLLDSLGGLMDSPEIADMMTRLFGQKMAEEEERLGQVMARRSKPGTPVSSPGEGKSAQPRSIRWGEEQARGSLREGSSMPQSQAATPETEVMARPEPPVRVASPSNIRNRRPYGVMIGFGGAVLVLGSAFYLTRTDEQATGNHVQRETRDASQRELQQSVPQHGGFKDAGIAEGKNLPKQSTDEASASTLSEAAPPVHLLLKGLPGHVTVTVQLNGVEAEVIDGRIVVPGDGNERTLTVSAAGYHPHRQSIAPSKDETLTVRMQKKSSITKKKAYTQPSKNKVDLDDDLMGCPYCKKPN